MQSSTLRTSLQDRRMLVSGVCSTIATSDPKRIQDLLRGKRRAGQRLPQQRRGLVCGFRVETPRLQPKGRLPCDQKCESVDAGKVFVFLAFAQHNYGTGCRWRNSEALPQRLLFRALRVTVARTSTSALSGETTRLVSLKRVTMI